MSWLRDLLNKEEEPEEKSISIFHNIEVSYVKDTNDYINNNLGDQWIIDISLNDKLVDSKLSALAFRDIKSPIAEERLMADSFMRTNQWYVTTKRKVVKGKDSLTINITLNFEDLKIREYASITRRGYSYTVFKQVAKTSFVDLLEDLLMRDNVKRNRVYSYTLHRLDLSFEGDSYFCLKPRLNLIKEDNNEEESTSG